MIFLLRKWIAAVLCTLFILKSVEIEIKSGINLFGEETMEINEQDGSYLRIKY